MPAMQLSRMGTALRPGALRCIAASPCRTPIAARRMQTARVASTDAQTAQPAPLSTLGQAPAAGDGSVRQLPVNYSTATRYTVDNVAAADAAFFQLHPSVAAWAQRNTKFSRFNNPTADLRDTTTTGQQLEEMAAAVQDLLATSVLADAESAAYWAYHLGRMTFFLGTSASAAVAHHLAAQLRALTGGGAAPGKTVLENLAPTARSELLNRSYEAVTIFKQDLANIKAGAYKLPWDMTTPTHRQFNPVFVLNKSAEFLGEAVATLNRRMRAASTDNWFASNMYPSYYADNTFHYQGDGWLSERSASIYEFSTESLFFGRQDAMQRTSLLPIADHIRQNSLDPAGLRLLEVCCGTGRFHTFIKDNYPSMPTIASDLSPFYLAKARENIAYWKSQRAAGSNLDGTDNTGTDYMQCAMESIPLPDASIDILACVYAFHEMPEDARAAAATEFHRVLKPGGLLVLTDSVQLGDRPEWDKTLGAFGNFNEPHYRSYIACDLGALMRDAGFACGTKFVASASKTLSFTKPSQQQQAVAVGAESAARDAELFGLASSAELN